MSLRYEWFSSARNIADCPRRRPGLAADLVLLDRDPFDADPQSLLDGTVVATLADGEIVHDGRVS